MLYFVIAIVDRERIWHLDLAKFRESSLDSRHYYYCSGRGLREMTTVGSLGRDVE